MLYKRHTSEKGPDVCRFFRFSRELKNQEENTNGRQIFNSHEVSLQTVNYR